MQSQGLRIKNVCSASSMRKPDEPGYGRMPVHGPPRQRCRRFIAATS